MSRLLFKGQQTRDKIPELIGSDCILADCVHLQTRVAKFDQSCGRYASEAFMVEHVGENLAQGGLPRLDAGSAGVATEGCLHASGVVWGKRFFVNWFPNGYWEGFVAPELLQDIRATGALFRELRLQTLRKSFLNLGQGVSDSGVDRKGAEGGDVEVGRGRASLDLEAIQSGYRVASGCQNNF